MKSIASAIAASALIAVWMLGVGAQPKVDPLSVANFWQPGDLGERLFISGRVVSTDGSPLAGAAVHIRQADGTGAYQSDRYHGSVQTAEDGSYQLNTVLPGQGFESKHIHLHVTHEFHQEVVTEILFKGDPNLDPITERDIAIPLESAQAEGESVLFGNFEVVMQPLGGN